MFKKIGLDWADSHNTVLKYGGTQLDLNSQRSQHFELFAALSKVVQPKRILEIGTSEGYFTTFLARLFPNCVIETIDLPISDQRFWNAIDSDLDNGRDYKSFLKPDSPAIVIRNQNLQSASNVIFREANSLSLSRLEGIKYDIIWVDGDHTFPTVACDIANSIRLLDINGLIICDDVFLDHRHHSKWGSDETFKVLNAFKEANLITTEFVLKSINPQKNYSKSVQKYLAIVKIL